MTDILLNKGVQEHKDRKNCIYLLEDEEQFSQLGYKVMLSQKVPGLLQAAKIKHNGQTELIYLTQKYQTYINILLDPPEMPQKPNENLLATLFPAIAMLVVTVLLRSIISSSGGAYVLLSACTMGIGIFTSLASYFSNKKKYKQQIQERQQKYDSYIAQKRKKIETARDEEKKTLDAMYFSSQENIKNVLEFSGELFDRACEDEDYEEVRVGTGERCSLRPIKYKEQERIETQDELTLVPEQLSKEYRSIDQAPVTLPLGLYDAVGVIGSRETCIDMLKVFTLDLAARHYPSDLHLYYIVSQEHAEEIEWVRWLPHVDNQVLGMRNIVCDTASRNYIFESLFVKLSAKTEKSQNEAPMQRNVVFVIDDMGIRNHPVSQYIKGAREKGFCFVFFDRCKEFLPQNCGAVVRMGAQNNEAELIDAENSQVIQKFSYETLADKQMENVALKLAPVFCDEVSLESSLTKNYSFFQMMNIFAPEDIDLDKNWTTASIESTMAAPLGINAKKELVMLNLHEKAHGPHGLVAGTTGSGKSEILQSYILSMAIHYHPYEVGFVIIDFKGGGMANQFKNLPHLIGTITNIDGREIDRSLKSIKAELQKRQKLFAEYDVNRIDRYIQKFKKGETKIPLPHLIIIVDEFAELKADQPEFMKELISAARIGRSLGVHLILATQKPSGQVNEQIWSNSKFKLCLKVQNQEDSKEVLKSPLAAEIREPGRAYLQVGNNEIFELFQSAYSGGAARTDESDNNHEFALQELNLWGQRTVVYRHVKPKVAVNEKSKSQLDVLVDYVYEHCLKNNIAHLPNICLPSLPAIVPYQQRSHEGYELLVDVGVYDDPDNQYQGPVSLDIAAKNTIIIGSAQNGKTTLLQTIIRALEDSYTPDRVNLYILDFGSMVLKNFESSKYVGGVVCASDDEKLKNLFRLLYTCMEERKARLAAVGVSSFASYCEAGYKDLPQIVVVVDNYTALKELYLADEDLLLPICRDGLTMGISVVMTNVQTNGIGFRYMSNFAQKIVLSCNDTAEYSTVLDKCRMTPANYPGRGLIEIDKSVYEFQTYLPFEGEKEIERVEAIRVHTSGVNDKYPGPKARQIPQVPAVLDSKYTQENFPDKARDAYIVPIGIDYETVQWCTLDLCKALSIAVTGREKFGKTNYTGLIMDYLQNNVFDYPAKAYIIDDYERQLQRYASYGFVEKYTVDSTELEYVLNDMESQLKQRLEMVHEGESIQDEPLLLCVLQNSDLMAPDGIKKATAETMRRIMKNYARLKVCFLFASVENSPVPFNGPEGMKLAKECRNIMLFDDLSNLKLIDMSAATLRMFKKNIELGDGYLITEKGVCKQKIIRAESVG